MQIFHDHKADSITIIHEAHRVLAWVLLAPATIFSVAMAMWMWRVQPEQAVLTTAFLAAVTAAFLWLFAYALTERVATFDGKTRTLTLRRERPWRSTGEEIAFADVASIETSQLWLPDATLHRLDIMLMGERRFRMHYNPSDRDEVERASREAHTMLRRPRTAAAS